IARIAALGVNTYAFSISWPRIFPFGSGDVNEAGLQHYDDVIDTCVQYGITPVVTLYHWDLPLNLQLTYGGWLDDQITNDFSEYARVTFTRWSSKVQHWVTINEPGVFCNRYPLPEGYFNDSATADIPAAQQFYACARNSLLAHSSAYRVGKSINSSFSISFKNNGAYKIPVDDTADTAAAVQRAWDFNDGLWATPVFLTGDFPESVKEYVSGFLPAFTEEQKAQINGTSDIFMIDAYGGGGFVTVPRDVVSEFGMPEPYESLRTGLQSIVIDPLRSRYYREYLQSILMAMAEGVNVVGTLAWSVFDNFEWDHGYSCRFGVQERYFKASAFEYVNTFKLYQE
ncbi:hypothetical protein SLS63_013223, partial [Diaporthe eres]